MEANQKMLEKEAVEVGAKHQKALGEREAVVEVAKEGGSHTPIINNVVVGKAMFFRAVNIGFSILSAQFRVYIYSFGTL